MADYYEMDGPLEPEAIDFPAHDGSYVSPAKSSRSVLRRLGLAVLALTPLLAAGVFWVTQEDEPPNIAAELAFPTLRLSTAERVLPEQVPLVPSPDRLDHPSFFDMDHTGAWRSGSVANRYSSSSSAGLGPIFVIPDDQQAVMLRSIDLDDRGFGLAEESRPPLLTWYRLIVLISAVALFLYLREILGFSTRAVALRTLDLAIESTRRR